MICEKESFPLIDAARSDILKLAARVGSQMADGEPLGEMDVIGELIRIAKLLDRISPTSEDES
jgi:hypothetical protein